jgi:adenylylsulfate kinase-like enzyme
MSIKYTVSNEVQPVLVFTITEGLGKMTLARVREMGHKIHEVDGVQSTAVLDTGTIKVYLTRDFQQSPEKRKDLAKRVKQIICCFTC